MTHIIVRIFLSVSEHLNSFTPPLCSMLEIFSVHAVTGNDTTYPFNDLMRRLHLPFQRWHGSFPKLHNPRLSKPMFLAWQMTGVHVTEKEASKITSCTEIIKILIYSSFHRILEESRFFKEISEFCPVWFIMRQSILFHSNSLAHT